MLFGKRKGRKHSPPKQKEGKKEMTEQEAAEILESWHSVAQWAGHSTEEVEYEPSIMDANMFTVYIGDLIKEISSNKVGIVDEIGKDGIVARIGDMQSWMSSGKFLWLQSPSEGTF